MKTELEYGSATPFMYRDDPSYGDRLKRMFMQGLKETRERRRKARKECLDKLSAIEKL